jgi:hypothetical protein
MNKLIFLILLFANQIFAQNIIEAVVFDKETNKGIRNVNIAIEGSKGGTISDSRGYFFLNVEKLPITLIISHVTFETREIEIKTKPDKLLEIAFTRKENQIPEVNIFANKKVIELTKNKVYDISDFDFLNNKLVLLAYDWKSKQNPWIIYMNTKGDTIASTAIGYEGSFYKDCTDTIHLIGEKISHQVYFNGKDFELIYPSTPKEFAKIMEPCITELKNKLFIQQYSFNSQILSYYCADMKDTSTVKFRVIADDIGINMLYGRERFHSMGAAPTEADLRFEEMCFYDPIYSPLVKINDTICILNFVDNKLEFYNDSLDELSIVDIEFHKKRAWKENVFVDEKTNKIYTIFIQSGISRLYEINKQTGKLGNSTEIPNFKWIEKIIINDGVIYFMYRKNSDLELMRLFKLPVN